MMYSFPTAVFLFLQLFYSTNGTPVPDSSYTPHHPQITTIHQFSKPTWIENIAQRASGPLLVTELTHPNLWQLDPFDPSNATLITTIPSKTSLFGITEYAPDTFAILAGNFSLEQHGGIPGSFSIYSVDFTSTPPKTSLLVDIPGAGFLNGLTFLPPTSGSAGRLLAGDAALGVVWSVDPVTLATEIAVRDNLAGPCPATIGGVSLILGINGLKYSATDQNLYFSNSFCQDGLFAKVPINPVTGRALDSASVISSGFSGLPIDDFAIGEWRREAYVALGTGNVVDGINLVTGNQEVIAGALNSSAIPNPTSVHIGRTAEERSKGRIYVTTTGGLEEPINGTILVGGQVVAVDLGGW